MICLSLYGKERIKWGFKFMFFDFKVLYIFYLILVVFKLRIILIFEIIFKYYVNIEMFGKKYYLNFCWKFLIFIFKNLLEKKKFEED